MNRRYLLHPFLFAIYPVLFLFAENIQQFRLNVLLTPLFVVISLTGLIYFLLALALKRRIELSAVLTSFLVVSLLYYNRILGILEKYFPQSPVEIKSVYLWGVFFIFTGLVYLCLRYKNNLLPLNQLLSVVSFVLIIFPIITIVSYESKTGRMLDIAPAESLSQSEIMGSEENPDIYYLILDRYGGRKALEEQYGFNNEDFYKYLEQKGFYVADEASTNYPKTFLSLAASLNMSYLDDFAEGVGAEKSADESVVTPILRDNEVIRFLKKKGYTIVNIGSWWTPTQTNPYADVNYYLKNKAYFGADEFTTGYVNTTIAAPYLKSFFKDPTAVSDDPNNNIHRSTILYEVDALKRASEIPGPKFVFMHLPLPHDPFVFDANCVPITEDIVDKNSHQVNYLNQLQCANIFAKEMVETILASDKNSVILLQSDEGPFPMNEEISENQGWGTASDTSLREKFPILQSYYVPGEKPAFYEEISPVNSFRVVFNSLFGTKYDLLPDRSYVFQDEENYYNLIEVTERLR